MGESESVPYEARNIDAINNNEVPDNHMVKEGLASFAALRMRLMYRLSVPADGVPELSDDAMQKMFEVADAIVWNALIYAEYYRRTLPVDIRAYMDGLGKRHL